MYIIIMNSDNQVPIPFRLRDEEYKEQTWEHMQKFQRDKFTTYYHAHNQKHGCDICGGWYVTSKWAEHVKTKKHQQAIISHKDRTIFMETRPNFNILAHTQLQYNPYQITASI